MIQITPTALSKIVTATLESGFDKYPNQPMHPEDAMYQVQIALEVVAAVLVSGQVTISDKE
jgi:hypothetical protein